MLDVVQCIKDYNAGRDPDRLAMKLRKMRANASLFLRGTCHLFYQRLPMKGILKRAPLTWVCGDLHLENFGTYKGDTRLVYFDINDFDEAALAPCTWDLVRFLSSVLVSADTLLGVNRHEAVALCNVFLDAYADALAEGKARWVEGPTAEGMVKDLFDKLEGRQRKAYLDGRTERKGKQRVLRADGKKALPVTDQQRERVCSFLAGFAEKQPNPRFFRVLDVARRIAGTGSLGLDRYVILVEGKGSPDRNYLLDLKQALPSSLVPYLKTTQPRWRTEAHRVVAVMQRMQAVSMAFLHPVTMGGTPYVLRGLAPSEDRVALAAWDKRLRRLQGVMKVMGEIVAWGQLRSGGRDGSAVADELIAYGKDVRWRKPLLDAAELCSRQVEEDWRTYAEQYDERVRTS